MNIEVFISPDCPKSKLLLDTITDLSNEGVIERYSVINTANHPHKIKDEGLDAIPSLRIGRFTFHEGLTSPEEIKKLVDTTLLSGRIFGLDDEAR